MFCWQVGGVSYLARKPRERVEDVETLVWGFNSGNGGIVGLYRRRSNAGAYCHTHTDFYADAAADTDIGPNTDAESYGDANADAHHHANAPANSSNSRTSCC